MPVGVGCQTTPEGWDCCRVAAGCRVETVTAEGMIVDRLCALIESSGLAARSESNGDGTGKVVVSDPVTGQLRNVASYRFGWDRWSITGVDFVAGAQFMSAADQDGEMRYAALNLCRSQATLL